MILHDSYRGIESRWGVWCCVPTQPHVRWVSALSRW